MIQTQLDEFHQVSYERQSHLSSYFFKTTRDSRLILNLDKREVKANYSVTVAL